MLYLDACDVLAYWNYYIIYHVLINFRDLSNKRLKDAWLFIECGDGTLYPIWVLSQLSQYTPRGI